MPIHNQQQQIGKPIMNCECGRMADLGSRLEDESGHKRFAMTKSGHRKPECLLTLILTVIIVHQFVAVTLVRDRRDEPLVNRGHGHH
jgi:hypothetical protein